MKHTDLRGMFPAIPTPLTENGQLDVAKLEALVEINIAGGAKGLAPVGGTGEFTALSYKTRVNVVRETVRIVNGRVPVVAGVVSPGWAEAVEHGLAFKETGADALLLVTPFYVIPSQQGVIDYFRTYRTTVDLPLIYYDVPARTSFVSAVDTLKTTGRRDHHRCKNLQHRCVLFPASVRRDRKSYSTAVGRRHDVCYPRHVWRDRGYFSQRANAAGLLDTNTRYIGWR
ncbi:dihydrodipicolinate synthase family protein [Ochrobactrum cytisi]|nr:dihydrodipicolinate synthase family protein [Brucella cytisi]